MVSCSRSQATAPSGTTLCSSPAWRSSQLARRAPSMKGRPSVTWMRSGRPSSRRRRSAVRPMPTRPPASAPGTPCRRIPSGRPGDASAIPVMTSARVRPAVACADCSSAAMAPASVRRVAATTAPSAPGPSEARRRSMRSTRPGQQARGGPRIPERLGCPAQLDVEGLRGLVGSLQGRQDQALRGDLRQQGASSDGPEAQVVGHVAAPPGGHLGERVRDGPLVKQDELRAGHAVRAVEAVLRARYLRRLIEASRLWPAAGTRSRGPASVEAGRVEAGRARRRAHDPRADVGSTQHAGRG